MAGKYSPDAFPIDGWRRSRGG